mmetsp:Transcript_91773/g.259110  ORF Transcript_91773/g.259110 Transcript_91773/m.259110 type:complete len:316 (+) Transcript_91773:370-1317(+)
MTHPTPARRRFMSATERAGKTDRATLGTPIPGSDETSTSILSRASPTFSSQRSSGSRLICGGLGMAIRASSDRHGSGSPAPRTSRAPFVAFSHAATRNPLMDFEFMRKVDSVSKCVSTLSWKRSDKDFKMQSDFASKHPSYVMPVSLKPRSRFFDDIGNVASTFFASKIGSAEDASGVSLEGCCAAATSLLGRGGPVASPLRLRLRLRLWLLLWLPLSLQLRLQLRLRLRLRLQLRLRLEAALRRLRRLALLLSLPSASRARRRAAAAGRLRALRSFRRSLDQNLRSSSASPSVVRPRSSFKSLCRRSSSTSSGV